MPRSKFGNEQVDHDLTDHEDLPLTPPQDGQTPTYSQAEGKFVYQAPPGEFLGIFVDGVDGDADQVYCESTVAGRIDLVEVDS